VRILRVVVACLFAGTAAATTFHGPVSVFVPVELTADERRAVNQLACQGRGRLPLAYAMGRSTDKVDHSRMMIEAHCEPHARVQGHPVSHQSVCSNQDGPLRCEASREVLTVTVRGQQWRLSVADAVMTLREAFDLALFVDILSPLPVSPGDGYADETTEIVKCEVRAAEEGTFAFVCDNQTWMWVNALRSAGGVTFERTVPAAQR
jgi:hypothetical protein